MAGKRFTIVGVIARKGRVLGQSFDGFALMPIAAFESIYGRRQATTISVKLDDAASVGPAMARAEEAMRVSRGLRPSDRNNFDVGTADALVDFWKQLTKVLFAVVPAVVAIGVLVGGIVIMNIMLMAVTERTHEIGLRKAVGATSADVRRQFLAESIALAVTGGAAGVASGWALAALIASLTPLPARVSAWSIALALGLGAGIGLLFGVYPAARAARLDPHHRHARGDLMPRSATGAITENVRIALEALRVSKLRSALTILGVVIGVSTVMAMAAIVEGIRGQIVQTIEVAGPTTFYVMKKFSQTPLNPDNLPRDVRIRPDLTEAEADAIARLPEVAYASLWAQTLARIEAAGVRSQQVAVFGADDGYTRIQGGELVEGRWFTKSEQSSGAPVVVLQTETARRLFGNEQLLGREVQIGGRPLTVIGLWEEPANIFAPPGQGRRRHRGVSADGPCLPDRSHERAVDPRQAARRGERRRRPERRHHAPA